MNPNAGTSNRSHLLENDQCQAAASNIELELSPTKYEPCNDSDPRISDGCNLVATARHPISEKVFRAVKLHQLRVARDEQRSKSFFLVVRYTIALSLCTIPTITFSLEMIPERCKICLDTVELNTYFFASALCGGFGASLFCRDFAEYFLAKFLGGTIGSLGALFTMWMILQAIPPTNALSMISLLVGALGAMPGLLVYFLVKLISDECWSDQQEFEDDFSSLTKPIIEET